MGSEGGVVVRVDVNEERSEGSRRVGVARMDVNDELKLL